MIYAQSPTLVSPSDQIILTDTSSLELQWNAYPTANSYSIEIGLDTAFTNIFLAQNGLSSTKLTATSFQWNTHYYWRVRADTGTGFTEWSSTKSFQFFNPKQLNSLDLWLRGDSAVVTGTAGRVSQWTDLSSNLIHPTQPDTGKAPALVSSPRINDMPALRFDGSNDFLNAGDTFDLKQNSRTLFLVGEMNSPTTFLAKALSGGVPNRYALNHSGGNIRIVYIDQNNHITSAPFQLGTPTILSAKSDRSSQVNQLYINTGLQASSSGIEDTSYMFDSPFRFLVGAFNNSSDNGETSQLDGSIAEIISYESALSDSTRRLVEKYLRNKYAPPVNLGPDVRVCDTTAFTIDPNHYFRDYQWSTGDTTPTISVTQGGTYTLTATDVFGFQSVDSVKVTDFVPPPPLNEFQDTTICLGDTVQWNTGLSASAFSFRWQDNTTDSFLTIATPGAYSVTVTDSFDCPTFSDTASVQVDSFANSLSLGPDTAFCAGNFIGLNNISNPNLSYVWSTGDTMISIPADTTGDYAVTATNARGCQLSDTIGVTIVGQAPTVSFGFDTACLGNPISFTDSSVAAQGDSLTGWKWEFGDGDTSALQNPQHAYDSLATFDVSLTLSTLDGCSATATDSVFSSRPLPASFSPTIPAEQKVISNLPIQFRWQQSYRAVDYALQIAPDPSFDSLSAYLPGIVATDTSLAPSLDFGQTYFWRVAAFNVCGDSTTSPVSSFTLFRPNNLGAMELWLRGDSAVVTDTVGRVSQWTGLSSNQINPSQADSAKTPKLVTSHRINDMPALRFDGSNDFLNAGDTFDLKQNSRTLFLVGEMNSPTTFLAKALSGGVPNRYALNHSGGNIRIVYIDQNNHITSAPFQLGTPTILSAKSDRSSQVNQLYINTGLQASSSGIEDTSYMFDSPFRFLVGAFNNSSDNGETSQLDGSIAEIISYESALSDSTRRLVEKYLRNKYAPPVNLGPDVRVCDTTAFTIDPNHYFRDYQWSTGDTTPTISVTQGGTYTLTATDVFGFQSVDSVKVTDFVPPPPLNEFQDTTICLGDTVQWNTGLSPSAYSFEWKDVSTDSFFNIASEGEYNVRIVDTFECITTDTAQVQIDSFATNIELSPDTSLCSGNAIGLATGDSLTTTYQWSTGSTDSVATVSTTGNYSVTATNQRGCTARDTVFVDIFGQAPEADFATDTSCLGTPTAFTDQSTTNGPSPIDQWTWDFGDADSASTQNPTHLYDTTGVYPVTLTVTTDTGCTDEVTKDVLVSELPQAAFTYETPCAKGSTEFTSQSATPALGDTIVSWQWAFGDGSTSTRENPVHSFDTTGMYPVTLTVTTARGCTQSTTDTIEVFPALKAGFAADNLCFGDSVQFEDTSPTFSIIDWYWEFDDGTFSTEQNPSHVFQSTGTFDVSLAVENAIGCQDTVVKPIELSQQPQAAFQAPATCEGEPYTLQDNSNTFGDSITAYRWTVNDSTTFTEPSPTLMFPDSGVQDVGLHITTSRGCSDATTKTVTVNAPPDAKFDFSPKFGGAPLVVSFTNETSYASSYFWDFGDSATSTEVSPTHTFNQNKTYEIVLVATDSDGCSDTTTRTLDVKKAILDIAVRDVLTQINVGSQGDFEVVTTGKFANVGTRKITSFEIYSSIGGGSTVSERWEGELNTGQVANYTLQSTFILSEQQNKTFICLEARNPNGKTDEDTTNNRFCSTLENDIKIAPPYPNPARDVLNLDIILPERDDIAITTYDIMGQKVEELYEGELDKGLTNFELPIDDRSAGVYFIKIRYQEEIYTLKYMIK